MARNKKSKIAPVAMTVVTFPPNGALPESGAVAPVVIERVPIGEAMRLAVEALGEIVIDDTLAPGQLRQLAESHADVTRRKAAWDARAEEAKTAKKAWESATELLLEQVRTFTRPTPLPLFDGVQREKDQAAMEAPPETLGDRIAELNHDELSL